MAERVRHVGTAHPGGMLQWGGVKDFADGSLGAHTALMHEPYSGVRARQLCVGAGVIVLVEPLGWCVHSRLWTILCLAVPGVQA